MPIRPLPALILALLVAGGSTAAAGSAGSLAPTVGRSAPPPAAARLHPDRQQEIIGREIGRMILIGFAGTAPEEGVPARIAAMIGAGRIGGVVLFADNVRSPAQVRRLTAALAAGARRLPPFIAIDQEGGQIQRLTRRKGFTGLPSARAMAAKNPAVACAFYTRTATELAGLGINTNFGPVVDLDTNPLSPAIGRKARSYADDPATVVTFAEAFIDAHRRLGVLTAAKHFPGHGSATGDSHTQLVDITATWSDQELEPYRRLVGEDAPALIMVGHLVHPRFSDGDRPASLSRRTLTEALRNGLGYDGLIVTDDLGMAAVARRFSIEDAAVMAVRAGADLIIVANRDRPDPDIAERVIAAVAGAVASGRIPLATIERAAARIVAARQRIASDRAIYGPPACPVPPAAREAGTAGTTGSLAAGSHSDGGPIGPDGRPAEGDGG